MSTVILLLNGELFAQEDASFSHSVEMQCDCKKLAKNLNQKWLSQKAWEKYQQALEDELFLKGFYNYVDVKDTADSNVHHQIFTGKSYKWFLISIDEKEEKLLRASGINLDRIQGDVITIQKLNDLKRKPLLFLENHGFPFAQVKLDSISFNHQFVNAKIIISKGPQIKIDSVSILGDVEIRDSYITNYLGVKPGALYSEKSIKDAYNKLQNLSFVEQVQPPRVYFNESITKVELYLKKRKASRFDGLVGFLPDAETGRLLVTGDATIHLENALSQGEVLDVNWKKLQTRTQQLVGELVTPFVFNSPISLDFGGEIYRRDTIFNEIKGEIGVRYVFNQNNYVRGFVERSSISLLSVSDYQNFTSAPPYLDRNLLNYGIGLNLERVDYLLNPSKGYFIRLEASAGNKTIVENALLPEEVYEELILRTVQLNGASDIGYYVSPLKRLVWYQNVSASGLLNDQLFNNEAYRIGGLLSLRGFNEQSIFATSYAIVKSELRYQIDRDGYVFGFFDGAWYENKTLNRVGPGRDTPFGFGAGLTFGTRAGIFSISYALGKEQGNPILLRNNKIHFGFLSVF